MIDFYIEEFCAALKYDQHTAIHQFYNDIRWKGRIRDIVDSDFNCLLTMLNDEINREFLDFIEGNGFRVEIKSMGKKLGLNVMDVCIKKEE